MDINNQEEIIENNNSFNNANDFFLGNNEDIFDFNQNNENNENKDDNKEISNFSFGDIGNKNVFNSINTDATVDANSQNVNFNISFFSSEKNEPKNQIKNKELTIESIEILKTFIESENLIITNNSVESLSNVKYINNIKDLKNGIFDLESKINLYLKKPYMRKNIKKLKKQNTNNYNDETIKKIKEKNKVETFKNDIKVNNCEY